METDAAWSKPSNGLSARLEFEVDASSPYAKVVRPKLRLRNESDVPIKFLWCVYDAGTFVVETAQGAPVQRASLPRSGGQGANVLVIQPGGFVELDAYDYGYGWRSDERVYAFHTASFQAELAPGEYSVHYRLVVDRRALNRMLEHYDWIREEPSSLWTGDVTLDDVQLPLGGVSNPAP